MSARLAVLPILGPLALGVLAADARQAEPRALEPVSTEDASGPFAADLDPDGNLVLAYTARSPQGRSRLLYRREHPTGLEPPEVVIDGAPSRVSLAAAEPGPAIALLLDGAAYLATRDADGWRARLVAPPHEKPADLALTRHPRALHLLVALGPGEGAAGTGLVLRRVVIGASGIEAPGDTAVRGQPDSPLRELRACPGSRGDELILVQGVPGGRLIEITGSGVQRDLETLTLSYTRLEERVLPPLLMATSGRLRSARILDLGTGPALLWYAEQGPHGRLFCQQSMEHRFHAPELLHEQEGPVVAYSAAAGADKAVLAVLIGPSLHPKLHLRWFDGAFWGPWQTPPGYDPGRPERALSLEALIGGRDRARIVVQEVAGNRPDSPRQLVSWTAFPRSIVLPRR